MANAPVSNSVVDAATEFFGGDLFSDLENAKAWYKRVNKMRKTLATLTRAYDRSLKNHLTVNGRDSLPGLDFFRLPKGWETSDDNSNAVDEFMAALSEAFGDSDDE